MSEWKMFEVEVRFSFPVLARSDVEAERWAHTPSNVRKVFDPYDATVGNSYCLRSNLCGVGRAELEEAYIADPDVDLAEILASLEEDGILQEARANAYGPMLEGLQ